jgi:undecaprenyl-diphosphatase
MLEFLFDNLPVWDKALTEMLVSISRNPVFDFLMPLISEKPTWVLPVLSLLAYSWVRNKKKGVLLFLSTLVVLLLADSSATALKGMFLRPRPNETDLAFLIEHPDSSSFPSNHAANGFAVAVLFSIYHPKGAWVFLAAASLIAYCKIYLGDHHLLDVFAGALLGVGCAYLVDLGTSRLRKKFDAGELRNQESGA